MYFQADDGVNLYVTDQGPKNAPPIVLVHGLLCNFTLWERNVPELARSCRVITIDMRGHGYSLKPDVGDTYQRVAKDVRQVLQALDVKKATLIGWSGGAYAVHSYVEQFGDERLKAIGVVDMAPKMICDAEWQFGIHLGVDAPVSQEVFQAVRQGFQVDDFRTRQGLVPLLFAVDAKEHPERHKLVRNNSIIAHRMGLRCCARYAPEPDALELYLRNFMLPTTNCVVSHWTALGEADFRPQIASFPSSLRVLLMYGARSALFPGAVGQWMLDALPQGVTKVLKVFDESGHALHWEEPSKFNRTVAWFAHRP